MQNKTQTELRGKLTIFVGVCRRCGLQQLRLRQLGVCGTTSRGGRHLSAPTNVIIHGGVQSVAATARGHSPPTELLPLSRKLPSRTFCAPQRELTFRVTGLGFKVSVRLFQLR